MCCSFPTLQSSCRLRRLARIAGAQRERERAALLWWQLVGRSLAGSSTERASVGLCSSQRPTEESCTLSIADTFSSHTKYQFSAPPAGARAELAVASRMIRAPSGGAQNSACSSGNGARRRVRPSARTSDTVRLSSTINFPQSVRLSVCLSRYICAAAATDVRSSVYLPARVCASVRLYVCVQLGLVANLAIQYKISLLFLITLMNKVIVWS